MSPTPLPKIASAEFSQPLEPQALVTFLNRTLKRRGLVFGVALSGGGVELTVYETPAWNRPENG